jgi:hypothetical protein
LRRTGQKRSRARGVSGRFQLPCPIQILAGLKDGKENPAE